MHCLRVVTWNAEGMFVAGLRTRRASPADAVSVVQTLDADIVFVPEFGLIDQVEEATMAALKALGYDVVLYGYEQPELGSYGAGLLTRLPLHSHRLHHFSATGRTFIEAELTLPEGQDTLRLYGLHLDDRAEATRLAQVEQLLPLFATPHSGATIALGDFNAMSAHSLGARLLRTSIAGWLGRHLPSRQLRSVAERVNQMATGTAIARLLEYTSLHDLDTGYSYTISAK